MGYGVSRSAHKSWLVVTALVIGLFGPVFSMGAMSITNGPAKLTLDVLSWPIDSSVTLSDDDARFLSALAGGFLLGWGAMIWGMRRWVYDLAPEGVRKTILASLLAWFVLDSAGSIAAGTSQNAAFNVLVLLTAIGPLWRPAIEDRRSSTSSEALASER